MNLSRKQPKPLSGIETTDLGVIEGISFLGRKQPKPLSGIETLTSFFIWLIPLEMSSRKQPKPLSGIETASLMYSNAVKVPQTT